MNVPRTVVLLLVVFVAVYAFVAIGGGVRHSAERSGPAPSTSPSPLALGFDAWPLVPSWVRVRGFAPRYDIAPGAAQLLAVPSSKTQFRLAHFRLLVGLALVVRHPRVDDPSATAVDALASGGAVTVLVPTAASAIELDCGPATICSVSTE